MHEERVWEKIKITNYTPAVHYPLNDMIPNSKDKYSKEIYHTNKTKKREYDCRE